MGDHEHAHRHDRPVAEQLQELKGRLAELSNAMDELLARQTPPPEERPETGGPGIPPTSGS